MKLSTASPLLLLALPSVLAAVTPAKPDRSSVPDLSDTNPETGSHKTEHNAGSAQDIQSSSRTYKGTEAAPVDGQDGMPHAGPFVELTPDRPKKDSSGTPAKKSMPTSLKNFPAGSSEDIPEKNDGVMNDENRPVPQEGTRGTEGGVSEKDKQRKAKGSAKPTPQGPSEAPALPHSEQEQLDAQRTSGNAAKDKKSTQNWEGKDGDSRSVKGPEKKDDHFGDGGIGMEKPTDLPEKPHNIPHPEPKNPTTLNSATNKEHGPPVSSVGALSEGTQSKSTHAEDQSADELQWHEWVHSFVLSLTMILFSEIGDKTFLIAALMAMRHPRLLVFSSAFSALITMTILSAVLGHAVPQLLPKRFTTFAAALLFLVFGARMLHEGLGMPKDSGVAEEMREVEAELEEKEHEVARRARRRSSNVSPYALEAGRSRKEGNVPRSLPSPSSSRSASPASGGANAVAGLTNLLSLVLSPAWVQTFIMTFLGEWGDRSQIATIAMAAGQDYWWVTLGAITGHACCTGVAVIGGRALAGRVSMRVVTIGGAVAFLVFGVIYLYECWIE